MFKQEDTTPTTSYFSADLGGGLSLFLLNQILPERPTSVLYTAVIVMDIVLSFYTSSYVI